MIHAEVAHQSDPDRLSVLQAGVELVLEEVRAAVEDWQPMRERAVELAAELEQSPPAVDEHELAESHAFLRWLSDHHFTFLGYREYELTVKEEGESSQRCPGRGWASCVGLRPDRARRLMTGPSNWPSSPVRSC